MSSIDFLTIIQYYYMCRKSAKYTAVPIGGENFGKFKEKYGNNSKFG